MFNSILEHGEHYKNMKRLPILLASIQQAFLLTAPFITWFDRIDFGYLFLFLFLLLLLLGNNHTSKEILANIVY